MYSSYSTIYHYEIIKKGHPYPNLLLKKKGRDTRGATFVDCLGSPLNRIEAQCF